jgi:hypothetical protein
MKIKTLTQEQTDKLQVYFEKWLAIGLDTTQYDFEFAKPIVHAFYEKILQKEKPKFIFIMRSPLEAWICVCMMKNMASAQIRTQVWDQVGDQVWAQVKDQVVAQVGDQVWDQVRAQVKDQVGDQVRDQVWDQVRDQVGDQVGDQVVAQVGDQVWDQVGDQVGDQVVAQVGDQVWDQVGDQVKSFVWPYVDGEFTSNVFGFYDYFLSELKVKIDDGLMNKYICWQNTSQLGLVYPFDDICILSQKPTEIRMLDGKLHSANSPSVLYSDGFSVHSLWGVRVPEKYFKASPTAKEIMAEKNAEIRMVLIKRAGLQNMLSELDTISIDKKDDYELLGIKLTDRHCEFLKMVNPSTGEIHVEGVPPETKTVTQALAWRAGLSVYKNPIVRA